MLDIFLDINKLVSNGKEINAFLKVPHYITANKICINYFHFPSELIMMI
jgi:hypothetical protein